MVLFSQLLLFVGMGLALPGRLFNAIEPDAKLWPNHTLRYYFDSSYTKEERDKINEGVRIIQENTCINFREEKTEEPAIELVKRDGCHYSRGSSGYEISLNPDGQGKCLSVIGITIHEILHALGLVHTQTRPDRDNYITVNFTNMKEAFDPLQYAIVPILNITPYDYGSYMHYAPFPNGDYRSVDPDIPTIIVKDKRYKKTIGNTRGSFYDYHVVNEVYKCSEKCPPKTSAKCANGGVPHPRHCSICLCPSGFGGDFCDQRPGTCGKTFQATTTRQVISTDIGKENRPRSFSLISCTHWIQAPPGHQIELILHRVKQYGHGNRTRAEKASCRLSGFEFKVDIDPRLGGPTFCDPEDEGTTLVSDLNPVPLMLYTYEGREIYDFMYKAIPFERI